nr:hypothetical protein [Anaerolineae bacterium]
LFPGAGIALLLAVVLFLVALLWGMAVGRRGRWIAGGLSAVLLLTVAGFFNGWQPPRRLFQTPVPYLHLTAAQVQADRARGADEQARRSAFIDVAGWIRASTPPDSLFHFIGKQNEFFRYMTRRSLLYSWMDALVGVLNPATVADNSRLVLAMQSIDLYGSSKILEVLDDYGVDYLLAGPIEPPIQPVAVGDRLLSTSVLYRNSHYTVYDFQAQPLADVPPVFEFGAAWHLVHQDLWDGPPVYGVCSPINVYTVWQPLPGSLAAAGDIEYYLSVILQNESGTLIKVEQLLARHTPAAPPVPVNHNTRFEVPCTAAPGDYQVVLALAAWDTQTQTAQPLTVPGLGDYVYLRTITIGTPGAGTVQR